MKNIKIQFIFLFCSMLTAMAIDINPVGRVQYLEGDGAILMDSEKNVPIEIGDPIFPQASFQSNEARFELVDARFNTYWVGQNSQVKFGSPSHIFKKSNLYLAEGSVICKATRSCKIETPMGTAILPAEGTYLIEVQPSNQRAFVYNFTQQKAKVAKSKTTEKGVITVSDEKPKNGLTVWHHYVIWKKSQDGNQPQYSYSTGPLVTPKKKIAERPKPVSNIVIPPQDLPDNGRK